MRTRTQRLHGSTATLSGLLLSSEAQQVAANRHAIDRVQQLLSTQMTELRNNLTQLLETLQRLHNVDVWRYVGNIMEPNAHSSQRSNTGGSASTDNALTSPDATTFTRRQSRGLGMTKCEKALLEPRICDVVCGFCEQRVGLSVTALCVADCLLDAPIVDYGNSFGLCFAHWCSHSQR